MDRDSIQDLATQLVEQITARVLASVSIPTGPEQRKGEARLLTVKEAADYIARSEQAVRHLIFKRDLPAIRTGRNVRIDRRDLDKWIEQNRC